MLLKVSYIIEVCELGATPGYLFNEVEGYGLHCSHPYFHSIIVHNYQHLK